MTIVGSGLRILGRIRFRVFRNTGHGGKYSHPLFNSFPQSKRLDRWKARILLLYNNNKMIYVSSHTINPWIPSAVFTTKKALQEFSYKFRLHSELSDWRKEMLLGHSSRPCHQPALSLKNDIQRLKFFERIDHCAF
jgi:hypothetical protein